MPKKKNNKAALRKKAKAKNKNKNKAKQTNAKSSSNQKNASSNNKKKSSFNLDDLFHSTKEFNRDITIHKLTVEPINGGADLIEECELKLTHGHRYGLIGYNGAGKSTLLKKLASDIYRGKEIPTYLNVVYSGQEIEGNDLTVIETVLKSDKKREYLLKREKELKAEMEQYSQKQQNNDKDKDKKEKEHKSTRELADICDDLEDIRTKLKFIESDTAESRVSALLDGLQFSKQMKQMRTKDLSGGWRMRVSLASSLFVEPDLLLLDEPTNHLDFPSVLWLSEYLQFEYNAEKTIMIVSHDRRFLNDVCSNIIHLIDCKLEFYTGNYDAFVKIRNEKRIHQSKQYEKQQAFIQHNKEFIAKFAANKKWSTQAQSRQKMLDKLEIIEKVRDDMSLRFEFPKPPPLRNPSMIVFDGVTFGYFGEQPNTYILRNINIRFNYGDKVGILGANGAGKSTLVKLIMGKRKPVYGSATMTNEVQVGYFSQHHVDDLDMNKTPLQQLAKEFGSEITRQQLYAQLGRFNLGKDLAERKIKTLSGGQKSRVTLAILTWWQPHLIIMDEPTNHLDMPTIDGLAKALKAFDGSILVISHDQHFVETCCSEFWCVGNRQIRVFDNFKKCISFSKKSKAPSCLPREYGQNGHSQSEEKKEETPLKNGNVNKAKNKKQSGLVLEIDAEREIDKGLKKGLTPNGILRHCKGWKAVDGNKQIVNKLGFIMFNLYFDIKPNDENILDHFEFFEAWKDFINYMIPLEQVQNQKEFVDILVKTFLTAHGDKAMNAVKSYGLGLILESVVAKYEMISFEVMKEYLLENGGDESKQIAIGQMQTFVEMQNNDAENESDSDSDY